MAVRRDNVAPHFIGVEKHISELPLETILRIAKMATQSAAMSAVAAGRVVTGLENGKIVEYGPGALPLSPDVGDDSPVSGEEGAEDARAA